MSEEVVEKQPRRNPIFAFFESVFSFVLLMLMIVGLVTVAVKWEYSKIEFVGDDRTHRVKAAICAQSPEMRVEVAFLEIMQPRRRLHVTFEFSSERFAIALDIANEFA